MGKIMNIDFSNSNINQNYYYNNLNQGINVKKTNTIKKDTFELTKSKKDYSKSRLQFYISS